MAVKVIQGQVTDGITTYIANDIITGLTDEDEARLTSLNVAEYAEESDLDKDFDFDPNVNEDEDEDEDDGKEDLGGTNDNGGQAGTGEIDVGEKSASDEFGTGEEPLENVVNNANVTPLSLELNVDEYVQAGNKPQKGRSDLNANV